MDDVLAMPFVEDFTDLSDESSDVIFSDGVHVRNLV